MQVGQVLELHTHDGFRGLLVVVETDLIDTGYTEKPCFRCSKGMFYAEPENDVYYNVGNRAFWVKKMSLAAFNTHNN